METEFADAHQGVDCDGVPCFEWWDGPAKLDVYVLPSGVWWAMLGPDFPADFGQFDVGDERAMRELWALFKEVARGD